MAADEQNNYGITLELNLKPTELSGRFVAATFKDGSKVQGSDTPITSDSGMKAQMTFIDPSSSATTTDFLLKVGLDANMNGVIDDDEQSSPLKVYNHPTTKKPLYATVFGISKAKVAEHQNKIESCTTYLKKMLVPYAASFVATFYYGELNVVSGLEPTTDGSISINAFQQATAKNSCYSEWLTHNSGAGFGESDTASIPHRIWSETTQAATFFAQRTPFAVKTTLTSPAGYQELPTGTGTALKSFYESNVKVKAENLLKNKPIGTSVTLPQNGTSYLPPSLFKSLSPSWVPASTVKIGTDAVEDGIAGFALAGLSQYLLGTDDLKNLDVATAIGRGRVISPGYRFIVTKERSGLLGNQVKYSVTQILFSCAVEDLYDFNYEAQGLNSDGAGCQLGNRTGSNGKKQGRIYRSRIEINTSYDNPFDMLIVVNPTP